MLGAFAKDDPTLADALMQRRRYIQLDRADHLSAPGPKRILSIDGGGVRSAMSLAVLMKVEDILRRRYGNARSFRLSSYFDLVGGASSGSIIAALIASSNFSMVDIRDAWFELAQDIYTRRRSPFGHNANGMFNGARLRRRLDEIFGSATLGDDRLTTGLAIVARRVDTDQTVIFHNHPDGPHFRESADGQPGHRRLPIASALRASTACPEEFAPELVELTRRPRRTRGLFVDSSVTAHNNPALKLFMLCTSRGEGFDWPTGADNLQITSVGTGSLCQTMEPEEARHLRRRSPMRQALTSLLDDADHTGDQMMRLISSNAESDAAPKCRYNRYQAPLREDKIRTELGLGLSDKQVAKVRAMTDPDGLQIAFEIGQAIADKIVSPDDFAAHFDLPEPAPVGAVKDAAEESSLSDASSSETASTAASLSVMQRPCFSQSPSVRARVARY